MIWIFHRNHIKGVTLYLALHPPSPVIFSKPPPLRWWRNLWTLPYKALFIEQMALHFLSTYHHYKYNLNAYLPPLQFKCLSLLIDISLQFTTNTFHIRTIWPCHVISKSTVLAVSFTKCFSYSVQTKLKTSLKPQRVSEMQDVTDM